MKRKADCNIDKKCERQIVLLTIVTYRKHAFDYACNMLNLQPLTFMALRSTK